MGKPFGYGESCSDSEKLRIRTLLIAISQLILGVGSLFIHMLGAAKIMNEADGFANMFFTAFAIKKEHINFHSYHIVSAIMSCFMVMLVLSLLCGIFKYKSSLVWAWLLGNIMLCVMYAILLSYSFSWLVVGYIFENIIMLGLAVSFVALACPYYKSLKKCEKEGNPLLLHGPSGPN